MLYKKATVSDRMLSSSLKCREVGTYDFPLRKADNQYDYGEEQSIYYRMREVVPTLCEINSLELSNRDESEDV